MEWNKQILKMKKNIESISFKIKQSRPTLVLSNIKSLIEVFNQGN